MEFSHKPVLFDQTMEVLDVKPDGIYLDGTAGGGGHSAEILKHLHGGTLICVDQDPDAIITLQNRFRDQSSVRIVQSNFSEIPSILSGLSIEGLDGVLLDIGVSSHQLDTAERGFSYHHDAPLDMRMSRQGKTAAELVNTLSYHELVRILFSYGEESYAKQIARAIERERESSPIETTTRLAEIVKSAYPPAKRHDKHPARKTFQALRIAVNDELGAIERMMATAPDKLAVGGRLCVISFHSLEDRIVKLGIQRRENGCTCPREAPICTCGFVRTLKSVSRKPILPSAEEIETNPRSRSAKLRVAERV